VATNFKLQVGYNMVTFISEVEKSLVNRETDKIIAMLKKSGSQPDRDTIYDEVVCHYLPKERW
jgi:hypothetical protein